MKRNLLSLAVIAILLLLAACTSSNEDNDNGNGNTPPNTNITSGPEGTVNTATVTFTWNGADDNDLPETLTFSFRIDQEAWSAFANVLEHTFTGLAEGSHTFYVKARDSEGLEDPSPAQRTFTVQLGGNDTTPPDTYIDSGPQGTINYEDVSFTFSGQDDTTQSGNLVFSFYLDYDDWSDFSPNTGVNYEDLAEGDHEFNVRAMDEAGNVDPSPATRNFTIQFGPQESYTIAFNTYSMNGAPGDLIKFDGAVTNQTAQPLPTTFSVNSAGLPAGWNAMICEGDVCLPGDWTGTINPGETINIAVDIFIAEDATSGTVGYCDFEVTNDNTGETQAISLQVIVS